jgi:hypothetical protein
MKFVIISSWNGEGYSYQNTAEVLDFIRVEDVQDYLEHLLVLQGESVDPNDFMGPLIPWKVERSPLCITYENSEDAGSFQAFEFTSEVYGVIISTNVNDVDVVDEGAWNDRVMIALQQADPDDIADDPEGYELDEEGRMFIPAYEDDYDHQFIKLA